MTEPIKTEKQPVAIEVPARSIQSRASRGSAQQMLEILSQAPQVEPEPDDRLPATTNG